MWIVRLALNRPYTFIVASILILVLGFSSIATTPTDIFPNIDIPVVTVIWSYSGLPAKEMEQRITTFSEFVMAVVNDVKAIDSQTVNGASVIKISFQPQVRIDAAMSQVGAAVNSIRFRMPPGVNPPWIVRFSASTVPIIQLSLSSDTLSESEIYDYGLFRVHQQLTTLGQEDRYVLGFQRSHSGGVHVRRHQRVVRALHNDDSILSGRFHQDCGNATGDAVHNPDVCSIYPARLQVC